MEKRTRLILALDVIDVERALKVTKDTAEYIDAIKVNYPLVLSAGGNIISELAEIRPVIADFKIADVPHISALIAETAYKLRASAVIAHGFAGSNTLKAILEVASRNDGEVYAVTELSSAVEDFASAASNKIAEMARKLGCHGIVAPATKPERITELRRIVGNLKIISPGIGVQGGEVEKVIKAGADFLIVGRSIYATKNPKKAAKEFVERIKMCEKLNRF
jgi:orotidine-5'-phosphate decarboxylase